METGAQPTVLRFSAAALPAADRLGIWREEFGRKFVNLDIAPLDDAPVQYDATFQMFGAVSAGLGQMSSVSCARTRPMIADSNDDILILVPLNTQLRVDQAGQEKSLRAGQALVRRSDDPGITWSGSGSFLTLSLPQAALCAALSDADRLSLTVLPKRSAALALLVDYAKLLFASETNHPPLQAAAGAHLLDLAALAIGANRDAWVFAQDRGAAAARLAMVEQIIAQNFTDAQLSLASVARRMGLSPGYLRKLLAARGQRFSDMLMAARLGAAHAEFQDIWHANRPISQIVYAMGFNDISYFNRAYKKQFDRTPSEARAMARLS